MESAEKNSPQFSISALRQTMWFAYVGALIIGFVLGGNLFRPVYLAGEVGQFNVIAAIGCAFATAILMIPPLLLIRGLEVLVDQRAQAATHE